MNKLILPRIRCLVTPQSFRGGANSFGREYVKDTKDDDDKIIDIEDRYKVRKGILHDKQQSLQEESYFHKEEAEKIKDLKKKMTTAEKDEKTEKKDDGNK